jgi:hypothetical protein
MKTEETLSKSSTPKRKVDWYTPCMPAILMILGVQRLTMHSESTTEFIANMILGALLIYSAFFYTTPEGK